MNELRVKALGRKPGKKAARSVTRPQPVTRIVAEILDETAGALKPIEVQQKAEQRLGVEVNPSSIRSALSDLVSKPGSDVIRVGQGRYQSEYVGRRSNAKREPGDESPDSL